MKHKLSASALNTFFKSPKLYYFKYVLRLEPIQLSVNNFDHDRICGTVWASAVDRFYKGIGEIENTTATLRDWDEKVDSWVPNVTKDKLTKALTSWLSQYYQNFRPEDGCRGKDKSELWLENDLFVGRLDGISDDGIIHEVKSTSRAKQLSEQLWKIGHSLQVKLYCVLADARGYVIETAFKDLPYQVYRSPVEYVTAEQKRQWESELTKIAEFVDSLGTDPANFLCTSECSLITKGYSSVCPFQILCEQGVNETTSIFYKQRDKN